MATKPNMYRNVKPELEQILNEINEWRIESDEKKIGAYKTDKANELRDRASNMQGKLQVLLQGLDKNSVKREEYEAYLKEINMFMDVFTEGWKHGE